ncbi:MAG: adenine deaminase [Gemmatimonadota bacterium]
MTDAPLIAAARGDTPADTVLAGGRILNVFTGEVEETRVALVGDRIAGLGSHYRGKEEVDVDGAWILPGFIDAHVHIESSLATPPHFAAAVLPRGTTTVVSDPHEIANVHGMEGMEFMLAAGEGLPLTVFVMASSCVPATSMSTSGASLDAASLRTLLGRERVLGLAEVMNFPGVIHGDPQVLAKLHAFRGRPVDGHAPGLRGADLNAYAAAGPGSDHECTTVEEAEEKLRRGLYIFFREATNAHNLADLLPALSPASERRICLCTDDRHPGDLLDEGGIDAMLRFMLERGVDPVTAVRTATLNPAEYFGLRDRGAVVPGRRADLVVVDDLETLRIRSVWAGGTEVARDGGLTGWTPPPGPPPPPPAMRVHLPARPFRIPAREGSVRVIEVIPDQIVTGTSVAEPRTREDEVVADLGRDLLKIAVVERHTGSGRVGLGLVHGMGLSRGAMATTVAHDHHNIIAVGADDVSILTAVRAVADVGGGMAVSEGEHVRSLLPLPVGGLMSAAPVEEIRRGHDAVVSAARALGSPLHDPFMALSFLGLEVIPSLKITDRGLVDVDAFAPVDLWV